MQCLIWKKLSLNLFQMQTCIYSLKKAWDLLTLQGDKVEPTTKYLKYYDPKKESKHIQRYE